MRPVELGLLVDEVDVATDAVVLRAVHGRARTLDDVHRLDAIEAGKDIVTRIEPRLAPEINGGRVTPDGGSSSDAVLRRRVDAGRELREVARVMDLAVLHPRLVDRRYRSRRVDDAPRVAEGARDR